jgi:hypothetical protein
MNDDKSHKTQKEEKVSKTVASLLLSMSHQIWTFVIVIDIVL